jgi:hypothetical protein
MYLKCLYSILYIHICVCIYAYTYMCMDIYIYTHTCVWIYLDIYTYICIRVCIYIYIFWKYSIWCPWWFKSNVVCFSWSFLGMSFLLNLVTVGYHLRFGFISFWGKPGNLNYGASMWRRFMCFHRDLGGIADVGPLQSLPGPGAYSRNLK